MQKIIMLLSVVAALSSFGPLTADADAFYESGNLTITGGMCTCPNMPSTQNRGRPVCS